jgi:tetratricopeptide (TPR) repeat protein
VADRASDPIPGDRGPPGRRPGPGRTEAIKRDIIALFKRVDGALTDLGQLKEDIRTLVDRYKQANAAAANPQGPAPAPQFTGTRPAVHADHLGASTFIEKGWSLISLGDYAGAIQALDKALALSPGATQAQSLLGWAQMLPRGLRRRAGHLLQGPHEGARQLARPHQRRLHLPEETDLRRGDRASLESHPAGQRPQGHALRHYYLGLVYLEREMYEDAQTFFRKTLALGPNLIEAYFELGRALWFTGERDAARQSWADGHKANKFNPWAKRCKEMLDLVAAGGEVPRTLAS